MNSINLILLPGLDGTGRLFKPLLQIIPSGFTPRVVSYPPDERLDYDDLHSYVQSRIPANEPFVILAESFSGPIAVRIAATHPANLRAMILCASFVTNPHLLLACGMMFRLGAPVFEIKPPAFLVRRLLLGKDASVELVKLFQETLQLVMPSVLQSRLQNVSDVDVRDSLSKCQVPILYLAAKRDNLVSNRSLVEIKSIRPDIESIIIDGPHFLLQSKPQIAVEAMMEFLRRKTPE